MDFTIGIGIAAILILLLWVVLLKSSNKKLIKIHDAALTCEELETHAKEMAVEHIVSKKKSPDGWPIPLYPYLNIADCVEENPNRTKVLNLQDI